MPPADHSKGHKASSAASTSKPFSLSIGGRAPAATPRKRPHSTLDDGSESDDDKNSGPQLLSGFDRSTGRAIAENEPPEKKPLVIAEQKNRDWRLEAGRRKGKNLLPEEEQARRAGRDIKQQSQADPDEEEAKPTYGLLVTQRVHEGEEHGATRANETREHNSHQPAPKTADEEALEALLGNGTKASSLVIANSDSVGEEFVSRGGDGNDFKSDVDARPEVPSLSDYAAVPIEEFGKALMRGMGWKEGEELGKGRGGASKPREVKRRPALLGIGAKEVPEGLEEIGAWGKGAKKSRRIDRSYMPLVMQNEKTGEKLTEDELAKRRQNETMVPSSADERGDRRAITDSDTGSAHRHRDRHGDRHRDRSERNGHSSRRDGRDHSSSHRHRDHRDSDRDRSDRDRSDRDRKEQRDDNESDRRRDRERSSRNPDEEDRRRRKHDDRDRRDRERVRERSRERDRRR